MLYFNIACKPKLPCIYFATFLPLYPVKVPKSKDMVAFLNVFRFTLGFPTVPTLYRSLGGVFCMTVEYPPGVPQNAVVA